jgi:anaphase-promoting complex subunit 5
VRSSILYIYLILALLIISIFSSIWYLTVNRNNKSAVEALLSQLQAMQLPDTDISLTLSFFNIEFLIRDGDYSEALRSVDRLAQSIHQENFDVYAQVKLLCLKARIFEKTGQPHRGFSLAMRAASIGHRSRLLPGLWEAIGVLARILLSLREFEAAGEIAESIMPQVLETEDRELTASSYSILIDANMGMAGEFSRDRQDNAIKQKEYVTRALEYIDCAYDEYEAIEDVRGQCEMLAKKATVMHLSGDVVLANDWAAKYLDLKKQVADEM